MSDKPRAYRRVPEARIPGLNGPFFPDNIDEFAASMTACGQSVTVMVNSFVQIEDFQSWRVIDRRAGGEAWVLAFFQVQGGNVVLALPAELERVLSPAVYLLGQATELEAKAVVTRAIRVVQSLGR